MYSNIIDYVSGDFCATETDYLSTISYNGDSYLLLSDTTVWFDYDRQSECCYLGRMKGESIGRRNVKNFVYGFNGDPERNFLYITDAGWPQDERLYIKTDIGYPVLNAETVSKICYEVLIDGSVEKEVYDKNEITSLLTEFAEQESRDIRIVAYLKDYPIKVIIGYAST